MAKIRSGQEWKTLFERYESNQLSQLDFCERHRLSLSTFCAKRQQLKLSETSGTGAIVKRKVETLPSGSNTRCQYDTLH